MQVIEDFTIGCDADLCRGALESVDISVVIPAFNAEELIEQAIASILAQSAPVREIVIVDDGSTDQTVARALNVDQGIRVVRQDRGGEAAARNRGVSQAVGDWVAFLDADDVWKPDRLESQALVLDRNPDLAWVCGGLVYRFPDGRQRESRVANRAARLLTDSSVFPDFFEAARAGVVFSTCAMLIRTEVLREAGVFDVSLRTGLDQDMWYRIADRHPRIGYVKRPLFTYNRANPHSSTRVQTCYSDTQFRLIQKHLAPASTPPQRTLTSKELYFRRQVFRAVRHAARHGDKGSILRILESFGGYLRTDQRALAMMCQVVPGSALRSCARIFRRLSGRAKR